VVHTLSICRANMSVDKHRCHRQTAIAQRKLSAVPVARYFMVVGSALVILLLITGWALPAPPPNFLDRPTIVDRTIIRIRSERKWPEKVVLDTNQPILSLLSAAVAPALQAAESLSDETTDQATVRALAKPNLEARPIDAHHKRARAESRTASAFRSTHVARTRNRNRREECCRSGWAGRPAMPKTAPRRRVAHRESRIGWHFLEAN
jgi:hypothetical protein